jgi:hypothetical protein
VSVVLLGAEEMRLRLAAVPPELRVALRTNLRAAAEPIASRMRTRSQSSRIPGAISVQSKFGPNTAGVFIRVSAAKAPHARALNNRGVAGTFRHPVYGNRDVWVSQVAHPFFENSAREGRASVVAAAQAAIRVVVS